MTTTFAKVFSLGILSSTLLGQAAAASLDDLQGAWTARRTSDQGQPYTQTLTFEKQKFTFQVADTEGRTRFFARGLAKASQLGPFQTLQLSDLEAGRSPQESESVDEQISLVYILNQDTLTIASNFDRVRERQKTEAVAYTREPAKAAAGGANQLAGTWKLELNMNDQKLDYDLRISNNAGALSAVLISPRSGEHPVKSVSLKEDAVRIEIDRVIENNPVTFIYEGKQKGDELSGNFVVKGVDGASGTWSARKQAGK